MNVIGLDLSLACTGIAFGSGETDHYQTDPKQSRYERAIATRDWVRNYLIPPADLVIIEAIGTRFVDAAIAMAYVHAHVDHLLRDHRVMKVAPAMIKRFATGRGNADKHAMTVAAIRNGWACDGEHGSTDDEADAWHMWSLGMAALGEWMVERTGYREAVIEALRGKT